MSADVTKLINNEKWELTLDSVSYPLKTLMSLRLNRQKTRKAILAGPALTYGAGDHGLDAVIDLASNQMTILMALNARTNGNLSEKTVALKATDNGATVVNIALKGFVSTVEFGGTGNDGRLEATIHVDISTETPAVTT